MGRKHRGKEKGRPTTLCGDNTIRLENSNQHISLDFMIVVPTHLEGLVEKLEVRLAKEQLGGTLWVGGIGDDNIELVLVLGEESETVTNVDGGLGVLETSSHVGKELLGDTNDGL